VERESGMTMTTKAGRKERNGGAGKGREKSERWISIDRRVYDQCIAGDIQGEHT
jgi:hypothetical protein